MARGLNKVMLIGNLGRDPETRQVGSTSVCQFAIATNESYKDQQGQKVEKTEWHNIVAWGRLGEICQQYLRKGSVVYIEGKIQTRSWEKDGQKKYFTEIVCSDMQMLDSQRAEGGYGAQGNHGGQGQAGDGGRSWQAAPAEYPSAQPSSGPVIDTDKDDLPF